MVRNSQIERGHRHGPQVLFHIHAANTGERFLRRSTLSLTSLKNLSRDPLAISGSTNVAVILSAANDELQCKRSHDTQKHSTHDFKDEHLTLSATEMEGRTLPCWSQRR